MSKHTEKMSETDAFNIKRKMRRDQQNKVGERVTEVGGETRKGVFKRLSEKNSFKKEDIINFVNCY